MIVSGEKSEFAVQVDVSFASNGWVYGSYLLWVRGVAIGDLSDNSVDLKGCYNWMKDFIEKPQNRFEPGLFELSNEMAYANLMIVFSPRPEGERGPWEIYTNTDRRFHLAHVGMSSFDTVDLLLVADGAQRERLIWRSNDGPIEDAVFDPGTVARVFEKSVEALEPIMTAAGPKVSRDLRDD